MTTVAAAILLVPSGCTTLPIAGCGDESASDVCGRFQYQCGTVGLCYSCGVAKRVNCGECAKTQTCGGGGVPHVCWPPIVDGGDGGEEGGALAGEAGASSGGEGGVGDAGAADAGDIEGDGDVVTDAASDGSPSDAGELLDAAVDGSLDGGASDAGDAIDATEDAPDDAGITIALCPDDAFPPDDQ